jgi:hypothetical protein
VKPALVRLLEWQIDEVIERTEKQRPSQRVNAAAFAGLSRPMPISMRPGPVAPVECPAAELA